MNEIMTKGGWRSCLVMIAVPLAAILFFIAVGLYGSTVP